ncbi:MAG TPA: hypothetical protein GXZ90_08330 [Clostridiales bacterium]|nr:hypothetical protein [Clostridiales bacterium]
MPANSDSDGLFGNDTYGDYPYSLACDEFNEYIQNEMIRLGESVPTGSATVKYQSNSISISPYATDQRQSFRLYKNEDDNRYELTIKTRLKGHEQAELDQNSLKLLLAAFSSKPEKLYEVLYNTLEGSNDAGISKTKWTTVADIKVKYDLVNNYVVLYIKSK